MLAQFARGQHRDKDMARFIQAAVPVVLASRRQVSAMTDSYLSQTLTRQLGRPIRPRGPIDTDALRGVAAEDVYQRPYQAVWTALAGGSAYDAAVRAGTERLVDIVTTDMQMAKTFTSQDVLSTTSGVRGFARVISGDNTCALCAIASTQIYSREDLLPIHPNCSCDVEPLTAENPWDQDAMDARLEGTHDQIAQLTGLDPKDIRSGRIPDYRKFTVTNSHGEIGPVLSVRGQHFTGPAQALERAPAVSRLTMVDAQLKSYEDVLNSGGGTDWMRQQVTRLRSERDQLAA